VAGLTADSAHPRQGVRCWCGRVGWELDVLRVHLDTARYQLLARYPDAPPAAIGLLLAATPYASRLAIRPRLIITSPGFGYSGRRQLRVS
jgi:hypothetical protein